MSTLERFQAEVANQGGEACLPRNLSNEWLQEVSKSLDMLLNAEEEPVIGASPAMQVPSTIGVAALLTILQAKSSRAKELEVTWKRLRGHVDAYRLELAFEEIHRFTNVKYEPATIENILTNRKVRTWRE